MTREHRLRASYGVLALLAVAAVGSGLFDGGSVLSQTLSNSSATSSQTR